MSHFEPDTVRAGDQLPALELTVTRADLIRYAGASTDFNPIHWSDRHARALGLPGVVAHGMWTMGAALRIVTDWCEDPARLADYSVRFVRPVPVPDDEEGARLEVHAQVTAVEDGLATLALEVRIPGDKPVKVLGMATAHVSVEA
ncbi:Acyl dehydratase [Propionibacterium cyclohexanicum]|uniref:Acyl dehydratase n=1 Tax=Propionibacterium cyclohexanicum TaxID=64702 RepID=A0A1H9TBF4_9ACTN|nr:MaoC/PaaZ C-terminal domain-containing protein [Propionibacterium cyclohexanicum]SER94274.1 Acyl dehydratase [Propionibacterium cyclohexanicum]